MTLLERVVVSRKTPGDGRLMISAASAARLEALAAVALEWGGERGAARLHAMTCTCAKGAGHAHVHHFVESSLLKALTPGTEVALELDEGAATLRIERP
jgi:hypothetical protein